MQESLATMVLTVTTILLEDNKYTINNKYNVKILDLLIENQKSKKTFIDMFEKFLPLAMEVLGINQLPKMKFESIVNTGHQPSFGMYDIDENTLYVGLKNRHPVDILRTVAHELVNFRQDINDELKMDSGKTGSPEENQAHEIAGVIMRNFNKKYPEYLKSKPL